YIKEKINSINRPTIRFTAKALTIFVLVNSSFLFIPVAVDTRYKFCTSVYSLKDNEWDGIEQIENIISQNPYDTGIFCLTLRGSDYLLYAGSPEIIVHNKIANRNKTLAEFQFYCENKFESNLIYVFILKFSDDPYYVSLKPDLRAFLEQNCSIYFENSGVKIIGPIDFGQ
ncbi:MAG: hypothetical protein DRO88_05255, partial [Promethearchaeia archaeon]